MVITSDNLVDDLFLIHTSTIANCDYFKKRVGGYKNEKEIEDLLRQKGYSVLDGGQLVFSSKFSDVSLENHIMYFTVSDDDKSRYEGLYNNISNLGEVKKLFFVKVGDVGDWTTTSITTKNSDGERIESEIVRPTLEVFEFKDHSWINSTIEEIKDFFPEKTAAVCALKEIELFSYMRSWSVPELAKIYRNRFVYDMMLNDRKKSMMDFDSMIFHEGRYIAIESKEKDPIGKTAKPEEPDTWSFGWDTRRFAWYFYLNQKTGLDTWYLIREIDDQENRNLVGWKKMDIDTFCRHTVWHFERQAQRGSTVEVPYNAFENF